MRTFLSKHSSLIVAVCILVSLVIQQIRGPVCDYGTYSWLLWAPVLIFFGIFGFLYIRLVRARKS